MRPDRVCILLTAVDEPSVARETNIEWNVRISLVLTC